MKTDQPNKLVLLELQLNCNRQTVRERKQKNNNNNQFKNVWHLIKWSTNLSYFTRFALKINGIIFHMLLLISYALVDAYILPVVVVFFISSAHTAKLTQNICEKYDACDTYTHSHTHILICSFVIIHNFCCCCCCFYLNFRTFPFL